jgi:hypothetical protein
MEATMKLSCYAVALVVLLGGSVQMVRTHLSASQSIFCPEQNGCIPGPDIQWMAWAD